jgi:uncharacterized oxidoreductase
MNIKNRTIVITGGSAGIGLALALKFLELGNQVIITGRRQSLLNELKRKYPNLNTIQSDISDAGQIANLASRVKKDFPQLDVLINNAGISLYKNLTSSIEDLENLTTEMNTNFGGVIRTTSAFIDVLKKNKGTLINISSALAFVPMPCIPIYCATKAAIHSYTQSLRFQLENSSVEVIEVMPPAVRTDMTSDLDKSKDIKTISTDELVELTFKGLKSGKQEILPGQSSQLAMMRRLAPNFINGQLWKASKILVPAFSS